MLGRLRLVEEPSVPDLSPQRLTFLSSGTPEADAAMRRLSARYGDVGLEAAEVVVALGGDGLMLEALRQVMERHIPVFGMNCGSVGFLMNDFADDGLIDRLAAAKPTRITPLAMHVRDTSGNEHDALALNEVSLFRMTYQAMKVEIVVDGKTQMDELICDGILLATPAGSTAYNLSAHGPILPIDAPLLALTPISPFRPREIDKRPVSAVADNVEFKHVAEVVVQEARTHQVTLLFDPGTGLEERVLSEQFRY
jgi:NAD+ kinase